MRQDYLSPSEIAIKKALLDAHVKQIDIARKRRVSKQFINKVIKGQRRSQRVMKAIARAVGKRVQDLWPPGPYKKAD